VDLGEGCTGVDSGTEAVVSSARQLAIERGAEWFPGIDPARLSVMVSGRRERPRCLLVKLRVHDGRNEAAIVLKARRTGSSREGRSVAQVRPTLLPAQPLPQADMARREFVGLDLIRAGFADSDATRFGIARPLAELRQYSAFLMDYIDQPTMRNRLMARSRLLPGRRPPDQRAAWTNAGAWLRIYHRLRPAEPAQPRNADAAAVAGLFDQYADFLARHTRGTDFTKLAQTASQLMIAAMPAKLPLVLGHGDFVVRNLFESPTGQISVIDPMPRWLVPPYEDLARFVVGMRLLGLQVFSRGLTFGQRQLDAYESAFLAGYFGSDEVPREQLRAYQLLMLLDKWSATVRPVPPAGPRRLVDTGRRRLADGYFRTEARRLLDGTVGSE